MPLAVVRLWFIRRQRQEYRESRSQLSRERDALLQERFVQNRWPTRDAVQEIAQEVGKSSSWVQNWFARRSARSHATFERWTLNLLFIYRKTKEKKARYNAKDHEPPTSDVVLSPG